MTLRKALAIDGDAQGIQTLSYKVLGVNTLDTVDLASDFTNVSVAHALVAGAVQTYFIPVTINGTVLTFTHALLVNSNVMLTATGRPR